MLEKPIITLTTDFGLKDPFVGLMKGVILRINPEAEIIDITHNIKRHDIFEASQTIAMAYKYFPSCTIHVVVVDPGVGGIRRPLLVVTKDYYFIGPDNGVFTSIFEETQPDDLKVIHISSSHYFLPMKGSTFHGRDIFAPVAAWLSRGVDSSKFGEQIMDYTKIMTPKPELIDDKTFKGKVVSIDIFGNAITNITRDNLVKLAAEISKDKFKIIYKDRQLPMVNYYADPDLSEQTLSAIINSFGYLELFIYKDNAAEKFNIKIGDSVIVTRA